MNDKNDTGHARVAIYVRVSTIHQIDKGSIPMQRADLIDYARVILHTEDCEIYEDAGYSGKNTDRPKYQEMMKDIREGQFTHLLVWKIDRISRNLLDFASLYAELKDLGVIFVSKNEQFDTSNAIGEAMLKIILVFAELERNMASERITATMISKASNGDWNGGPVPYGYIWNPDNKIFSIDPVESEVVHLIHDLYEKYESQSVVARIMNERGYRSRAGSVWTFTAVNIILKSIFYCGDYRWNVTKDGKDVHRNHVKDKSEWVTYQNHHPAIIDRAQKERILKIMEDKSNKRAHNLHPSKFAKYVHIFGGLIYCAECGHIMWSSSRMSRRDKWRYTRYTCPTYERAPSLCRAKIVSDPVLGEFIFNLILNLLNVQKEFSDISSPKELEDRLLKGSTFKNIKCINEDDLLDLYSVLENANINNDIYGKNVRINTQQDHVRESELSLLNAKKKKIERALERLRNLYLYSDSDMPEKEYVLQHAELINDLSAIDEEINMMQEDESKDEIFDDVFFQNASEFIISQELTNKKYILFSELAKTLDAKVLRDFTTSIIDKIFVYRGKIQRIIFKNGLSLTFILLS